LVDSVKTGLGFNDQPGAGEPRFIVGG
jgi:hypothetical protein